MSKVRITAGKFARNASASAADYEAGALSPRAPQAASAIAAEPLYEQGVQDGIARKAFSRGLAKSGEAGYQKGIRDKGRANFTRNVSVSEDEWNAGFARSKGVIEGVTLTPRGPKGTNYGRVQEIGDALRSAKLAG
ncbi:MAG: hypothetical protein AAB964_01180 [Patescibacteria group bacterium]